MMAAYLINIIELYYNKEENKMKHEWRKHEKELYGTRNEPQIVELSNQKFFMIKGKGNPNDQDFSERIEVLYTLAYAVRMMPKSGYTPIGYFEYTVYPLEGVWENADPLNKESFEYTIMIRQPQFVTEEVVKRAFEIARKKKAHSLLDEVYFSELKENTSVQILHIGDYDDEPKSFSLLVEYMKAHGLKRCTNTHTEIYLSDARKTSREKLKTILRYQVKKE